MPGCGGVDPAVSGEGEEDGMVTRQYEQENNRTDTVLSQDFNTLGVLWSPKKTSRERES
jgi:hypothetical protein